MEWILAIGCVLGLGGTAFFSVLVWRLSRELTSVNKELVVEKSTNAALVVANKSLRESAVREKAARQIEPVPDIADSASTEEAVENIRASLRSLATRLSSVSPAGTAPDNNDLSRSESVHGTAPGRDHDTGDENPAPSGKPGN